MPGGVEYSSDYDRLLLFEHFVNYAIRKTPRIAPTNVFARMSTTMQQGIDRKFVEHIQELFDKSVAKIFAAAFVPSGNLDYVILCFRP